MGYSLPRPPAPALPGDWRQQWSILTLLCEARRLLLCIPLVIGSRTNMDVKCPASAVVSSFRVSMGFFLITVHVSRLHLIALFTGGINDLSEWAHLLVRVEPVYTAFAFFAISAGQGDGVSLLVIPQGLNPGLIRVWPLCGSRSLTSPPGQGRDLPTSKASYICLCGKRRLLLTYRGLIADKTSTFRDGL